MSINIDTLRFPIGRFSRPKEFSQGDVEGWVRDIENFPRLLAAEVDGLSDGELSLIYRPEGWSIRQLVHHCADSHMNSFIRYKLTITEEKPAIKPYFEDKWAEMKDYSEVDIDASLSILKGLHMRWVKLLRDLTPDDLKREFIHPEHGWSMTLGANTALYSWHCKHHLEHVKLAKKHKGAFN